MRYRKPGRDAPWGFSVNVIYNSETNSYEDENGDYVAPWVVFNRILAPNLRPLSPTEYAKLFTDIGYKIVYDGSHPYVKNGVLGLINLKYKSHDNGWDMYVDKGIFTILPTVFGNATNSGVTIDNTGQALGHYLFGDGSAANIGLNTVNSLLSSPEFINAHEGIIHDPAVTTGSFPVDMTRRVFHIGDTRVSFVANFDNQTVTYKLFDGDGFWDPDFIDEYFLGDPLSREQINSLFSGSSGPEVAASGFKGNYHWSAKEAWVKDPVTGFRYRTMVKTAEWMVFDLNTIFIPMMHAANSGGTMSLLDGAPDQDFSGFWGGAKYFWTGGNVDGYHYNIDGKATGLSPIMGMPPSFIGGPLRKGQSAIKLGKYLFNPNYLHTVVKPQVLKGAGDFIKVVGHNPDIGLKGTQIILNGAKKWSLCWQII